MEDQSQMGQIPKAKDGGGLATTKLPGTVDPGGEAEKVVYKGQTQTHDFKTSLPSSGK